MEVADQLQPFLFSAQAKHVEHIAHRVAQIEINGFKVQLAGLDLGKIENVVNDAQQCVGRRAGQTQVFGLLGLEIGVQRQLQHALHAIHGGADFMAHVGQELALGAACGLCRFFGCAQLHRLFMLGDVVDHPDHAQGTIPAVEHHLAIDRRETHLAAAQNQPVLEGEGLKIHEDLFPRSLHEFRVIRVNECQIAVEGRLAAAGLQAKEAVRLIRPGLAESMEIDFPASQVSEGLGLFQLRVLGCQLRLHTLALRHLPPQVFVQTLQFPGTLLDALFELALARPQVRGHQVEGSGKTPEFIARGRRQALTQVTGGNRLRGAQQLPDRGQNETIQQKNRAKIKDDAETQR